MNKPAFYKAPPRWHVLAALIGAMAIELGAVAAASLVRNREFPTITGGSEEKALGGVLIEEAPEPVPMPPEDPPPFPLPKSEDCDFVLTEPSPRSRSPSVIKPKLRVKSAVSKIAAPGAAKTANFDFAQASVIFSPHPAYPFEARRARQTGSGKFLLRFDANGAVTDVEVIQSTGSVFLDQASLRTLRQWRCQPGVYESVYLPITFTLHGVQL